MLGLDSSRALNRCSSRNAAKYALRPHFLEMRTVVANRALQVPATSQILRKIGDIADDSRCLSEISDVAISRHSKGLKPGSRGWPTRSTSSGGTFFASRA